MENIGHLDDRAGPQVPPLVLVASCRLLVLELDDCCAFVEILAVGAPGTSEEGVELATTGTGTIAKCDGGWDTSTVVVADDAAVP